MNALESVSEGEVQVNGYAIHETSTDLNKLRESVGMVFQRFNLFPHMTVLENLIMAPMSLKGMARVDAVELAENLLAKVGLSDKRDALAFQSFRWAATARGHCPCAGDESVDHAV